MSIDFKPSYWEKIREIYGLWWVGKLDRPIIPVILEGKDPGRCEPDAPLITQANCNDLTVDSQDIVDRIDYELSKYKYLGDAFPFYNLDCFGPGVIAAFLGADLDNSTGRVWFHPKKILPISEIHFEYNPDNIWLNRIKDICATAMNRWQGQVLLGMPDIGGPMDILSVFRPADNLLLDLYDYPEEVNRLVWELHDLWHRFFNEINDVLMPVNPGYSNWSQLYCDKPSYVLQCDFSYMISPAMFNEFVKPELIASSRKLPHTMYHLDGIGQLNHLDSLLEIEELDAVQWVPGEGKPNQSEWPEVYRKIYMSGKGIQLFNGIKCLDEVAAQIGSYKGILHMPIGGDVSQETEYRRMLEKYGI
ncbi:MAG: hypothetical protein FIA99_02710 [Ruminiclostridium sp.]|nr:hypothetical protein [Ruminiclostridium sp.]